MSELATEIAHASEPITTSEFLGSSFEERRQALTQVEAFHGEAKQALADSVAVMVGRQVLMTFRPSSVTDRNSRYSFPVYSLFDDERKPLEKVVTVHSVDPRTFKAVVGEGEYQTGDFDRTWYVNLGSILSIAENETDQEHS